MNGHGFRSTLVGLLRGHGAHVSFDDAVEGLDPELRTVRPAGAAHSVWELVEHVRLAQEDILRYTLDPTWESPPWPDGYWPGDNPERLGDRLWEEALRSCRGDLEAMVDLVEDPDLDLTARIPHGGEHTYLREVLLVADHNAYHVGQIVCVRKALLAWPPRQE